MRPNYHMSLQGKIFIKDGTQNSDGDDCCTECIPNREKTKSFIYSHLSCLCVNNVNKTSQHFMITWEQAWLKKRGSSRYAYLIYSNFRYLIVPHICPRSNTNRNVTLPILSGGHLSVGIALWTIDSGL